MLDTKHGLAYDTKLCLEFLKKLLKFVDFLVFYFVKSNR